MRPEASTMLIAPSTFWTPWLWCSMPRACIRKLVSPSPHHSAAWRMARSAMPVTSRRAARRPLANMLGHGRRTRRVWLVDELVIEPVVLDHQMQDAVEQRHVAARLDRQEQIAGARDRRDARIDDDDLRARARAPARRSWS